MTITFKQCLDLLPHYDLGYFEFSNIIQREKPEYVYPLPDGLPIKVYPFCLTAKFAGIIQTKQINVKALYQLYQTRKYIIHTLLTTQPSKTTSTKTGLAIAAPPSNPLTLYNDYLCYDEFAIPENPYQSEDFLFYEKFLEFYEYCKNTSLPS
jgi:hypothetical protein